MNSPIFSPFFFGKGTKTLKQLDPCFSDTNMLKRCYINFTNRIDKFQEHSEQCKWHPAAASNV